MYTHQVSPRSISINEEKIKSSQDAETAGQPERAFCPSGLEKQPPPPSPPASRPQ